MLYPIFSLCLRHLSSFLNMLFLERGSPSWNGCWYLQNLSAFFSECTLCYHSRLCPVTSIRLWEDRTADQQLDASVISHCADSVFANAAAKTKVSFLHGFFPLNERDQQSVHFRTLSHTTCYYKEKLFYVLKSL